MAPDETDELEGLEDFDDSELDSAITEDDDDLEAQMAATMAAEGLDGGADGLGRVFSTCLADAGDACIGIHFDLQIRQISVGDRR